MPIKNYPDPAFYVDNGDGTFSLRADIGSDVIVEVGPAVEINNDSGNPIPVVTSGVGTPSQAADVTVDGSSGGVVLAAANAGRTAVTVQNTGGANMRVRAGGDPTATRGFQLGPGQPITYTPPQSRLAVKAIRESGTDTTASVEEVVT